MEKTAADILADDPNFKDYFKTTQPNVSPVQTIPTPTRPNRPVTAADYSPSLTPGPTAENPLAEYGVPPPGSDIKIGKNAIYFRYGTYALLAIIGLLVLLALFRLLTLA